MKTRARNYSLLAVLALVVVTGAGCMGRMVPKTEISGTIAGQPFKFKSPKNSELRGFKVRAETNGVVCIEIESLSTKMDPEVITTTGAAQAEMIKQFGTIAAGVTSAAVSAAK